MIATESAGRNRSSPAAGHSERRRRGRRRFQRGLAVYLVVFLGCLLALAGLAAAYLISSAQVDRSREIRLVLAEVLDAITEAETSQRALLLTGDHHFQSTVDEAERRAAQRLADASLLAADDGGGADRRRQLAELAALAQAKLDELAATTRLLESQGRDAAVHAVREGPGIRLMARIRAMVADLRQGEDRLLETRAAQAWALEILMVISVLGFAVGMVLVLRRGVRQMEQDYEAERAEGEALAAALSERNSLLAQKEDLLHQKDLLFREVNHRVKNSLFLASNLLLLQSRQTTEPAVRQQLEDANRRIAAIAEVHQRLYQNTRTAVEVDLRLLLQQLCGGLAASVDGAAATEIAVDAPSVAVPADLAVPLGLMVNELVTNALKYGRPLDGRPARVTVTLAAATDAVSEEPPGQDPAAAGTAGAVLAQNLRLVVADNGPGLPPGVALDQGGKFGLLILRSLAVQINARLTVVTSAAGTSISADFTPEPAATAPD